MSDTTLPSLLSSPSLCFRVELLCPSSHEIEVELRIPDLQQEQIELVLPAWIPGSYMIRDFARHVIELEAFNEADLALSVTKQDKQTWRITQVVGPVKVRYRVFAFDLSVRSAYYNDEYAFFNGTSVFLHVKGHTHMPHRLSIDTGPFSPGSIATSMPYNEHTYAYHENNYYDFIDHPIFVGQSSQVTFTVANVRFTLLMSGQQRVDIERIAADLAPICRHHIAFFGKEAPFSSYLFMTLLASSGYGGLEHRYSTALLFPRDDLPWMNEARSERSSSYRSFLGLCSHELFHAWHVKRTQPHVMQCPDLSREVHTPQLWIYEGITSYYDDLAVVRSGLITPQQYLQALAETLTRVVNTPGRERQSIAASSFDAWTKFYKQDAHSVNQIVSYYTQGSMVAFALDLWLRHASNNTVTLDNLMQVLWQHYGQVAKGTDDQVLVSLCKEQFDLDIQAFVTSYVEGKQLPPLQNWLHTVGLTLHWRARAGRDDKGGCIAAQSVKYELGASYKNAELGVTITQVLANSAAAQAGLFVDDKLLAINSEIVSEKRLQRHLDTLDTPPMLTVARDGRVLTLTLPLVPAEDSMCYFEITDHDLCNQWLLTTST